MKTTGNVGRTEHGHQHLILAYPGMAVTLSKITIDINKFHGVVKVY
jgi:hypothetical protein